MFKKRNIQFESRLENYTKCLVYSLLWIYYKLPMVDIVFNVWMVKIMLLWKCCVVVVIDIGW